MVSEWGRLQDALHDEFDRQGFPDVDVNAVIGLVVNLRDFFPGVLAQAEAVATYRRDLRARVLAAGMFEGCGGVGCTEERNDELAALLRLIDEGGTDERPA